MVYKAEVGLVGSFDERQQLIMAREGWWGISMGDRGGYQATALYSLHPSHH